MQASEVYLNVCLKFDSNDVSETGLCVHGATEIRCPDLMRTRYYCLCVKKSQREFHVVSRRAHGDRYALRRRIGCRGRANLYFQRLFDSDVIFDRDLPVCIHLADVDCLGAATHRRCR